MIVSELIFSNGLKKESERVDIGGGGVRWRRRDDNYLMVNERKMRLGNKTQLCGTRKSFKLELMLGKDD